WRHSRRCMLEPDLRFAFGLRNDTGGKGGMPVADLDRHRLLGAWRFLGPVHARGDETTRIQLVLWTDRDSAAPGINVRDIARLSESANAKPAALAHRKPMNTVVHAKHVALLVNDLASF